MAPAESTKPSLPLSAEYTSPQASHSFNQNLTTSPTPGSTKAKTAYLSELRGAVTKLQSEVNTFLTQKMEEDKANAAGEGGKADEKEEENYGEEVVEDDA